MITDNQSLGGWATPPERPTEPQDMGGWGETAPEQEKRTTDALSGTQSEETTT